jgi:hypothetical protein
MNDTPTPPSPDPFPGVPAPRPATAPASRPPALTGAAAILMIAGAMVLYLGVMQLVGDGVDIDAPFLSREGRVVSVVLVVQGCLSLLAGWLILRLRPAGRVLGIVITAVGIVSALVQLRRSGSSGFLTLALDAFVLYALLTYGFLFKQRALDR